MKFMCTHCRESQPVDLPALKVELGGKTDIRGLRGSCPDCGDGTTALLIRNGVYRAF